MPWPVLRITIASNKGNVMAFNVIFISGESNIFLRNELGFSSLYTKSLLIVPLDAHTTRRISLIGISTLPLEITPFLMVISRLPIKEESNGKVDIPIKDIRRVVCASNGTISKLLVYKEEKPSSFFKKIFDSPDMKITLNAITLPLLEAIVTRNTGHGIDFTRGNGFDQKDSNYIIIRYLDSGYFLDKDGTAPTEWQETASETTAAFDYDIRYKYNSDY